MTSLLTASAASMTQSLHLLAAEAETLKAELTKRRAKGGLVPFTEYTLARYEAAAHHHMIASKLEAVERGEIDRLMIFMPPRHGKSELVSVRFPAWFLGRNPEKQVIAASYAHKLASKFGRQVRNIIASQEFQDLFPGVALSPDSEAKDLFNTSHEGAYLATGVDGSVTGSGAHIALIDDPVKGRKEAESETVRDNTFDWYQGDLYTRLMPGAAIVICQTRWHEDDLSGRILEREGRKEDGGEWDVLELPALDAEGRALWPEWYDEQALERIRKSVGPRDFAALYQQSPQPDEGSFFKREWFELYKERPKNMHYYITSDHAPGDDDNNDRSIVRVWGVDEHQRVWLVDGYRSTKTLDDVLGIEMDENGEQKLATFGALPLIRKWKPFCWFPENDNNWKSVAPFVTAAMRKLKTHCRVEPLSPHGADKPTKARAIQAKASMGELMLPDTTDGETVLNELISFPAGKHDDEVDCASAIGRALDLAHPAIIPVKAEPAGRTDRYRRKSNDGGENWKTM